MLIIYKYHSMSRFHGAHEQTKAAPDIGAASIETNITTAKSEKLTKAKLTALEKRLIELTPKNADGTAPISLTYTQRKSAWRKYVKELDAAAPSTETAKELHALVERYKGLHKAERSRQDALQGLQDLENKSGATAKDRAEAKSKFNESASELDRAREAILTI